MSFFKLIFTWWNRQTFGTFIYTLFSGKYQGSDEFGNKYYSNKKGKRWVIYKGSVESSKSRHQGCSGPAALRNG